MRRLPPRATGSARRLRRDMTPAERHLWRALSNGQLDGLKFRRQHVMGRYVVDFVCLERKLVVELDGGQHNQEAGWAHDRVRTQWLNRQGFAVLRFWNHEVMENLEGVLIQIGHATGAWSE